MGSTRTLVPLGKAASAGNLTTPFSTVPVKLITVRHYRSATGGAMHFSAVEFTPLVSNEIIAVHAASSFASNPPVFHRRTELAEMTTFWKLPAFVGFGVRLGKRFDTNLRSIRQSSISGQLDHAILNCARETHNSYDIMGVLKLEQRSSPASSSRHRKSEI